MSGDESTCFYDVDFSLSTLMNLSNFLQAQQSSTPLSTVSDGTKQDIQTNSHGIPISISTQPTTNSTTSSSRSKPQACKVCGKMLSSASSYYVHMKLHSGTKPFQCTVILYFIWIRTIKVSSLVEWLLFHSSFWFLLKNINAIIKYSIGITCVYFLRFVKLLFVENHIWKFIWERTQANGPSSVIYVWSDSARNHL